MPHYCHLVRQVYQNKKSSTQKFLSTTSCRDGQVYTVLASELVPGDLVRFSTGDRIPADCRLVTVSLPCRVTPPLILISSVKAVDLEIDESNLTGENKPRRKIVDAINADAYAELALSERDNIAFMGTLVRNGT